MSEPTETWQPPPATQPPSPQPPSTDQPAPAWPPTAQPAPARTSLPGSVLAAAIVLFVMGAIAVLFSSLFLLSGSLSDQLPNTTGFSEERFRSAMAMGRAFAIGLGVVGLLAAAAHITAGVGIIRRAGWGRILGIVIAGLLLILSILPLIGVLAAATQPIPPGSLQTSGLTQEQAEQFYRMGVVFGAAIFGIGFLAYLFVLVALIRGGRAFS